MTDCCQEKNNYKKGFWSGLMYGSIPHLFCIAFLLFSIIGATTATTFAKKMLLIPNFFLFLIGSSFLSATISATIYLKKIGGITPQKIKTKWKYLSILYGSTITMNILMIQVIFPASMNIEPAYASNISVKEELLKIKADIPCSGHAPLIMDELKKDPGILNVQFQMPNIFLIRYNPEMTSLQKISELEIFNTFQLTLIP